MTDNLYYTYPIYATTNAATTLTITGANTVYGPLTRPYGYALTENAVIPDTAEQWLRRRVKEVCELAAA